MSGNRSPKSYPLRVMSRTRDASRLAKMRKPCNMMGNRYSIQLLPAHPGASMDIRPIIAPGFALNIFIRGEHYRHHFRAIRWITTCNELCSCQTVNI